MHIAIIQNWGLGDLVMTTPVIAEFRRLYPDSRLTLVVRGKPQAMLMEGSPLVDQILTMPARSDRKALARFILSLRREKFDVAFVGTRISSYLPWLLKILAGVHVIVGDSDKPSRVYDVRNKVDPKVHRVDRMLETFSIWSGRAPEAAQFPIPCHAKAVQEAGAVLARAGLVRGRFLVLHPGSSLTAGTDKRIPADVALRVAIDLLGRRPDLSVAYIFGPDEVDYIPAFADAGERQVVLSGHSLPVTIALISQAAGLIGTDSSLGHIAAAFGVPTATLCGPTIPSETAPYGHKADIVTRAEKLDCQPCWGTPLYGHCPYDVRCMRELPEPSIVDIAAAWPAREF